MGNRAVVAFGPDEPNTIGVYLHWNGGRASVEGFLAAARDLGIRGPGDAYSQARFCQIVSNWFGGYGGGLSVGVDTLEHSDQDNCDNGVYFIDEKWNIVGRKYAPDAADEEVDREKTAEIRAAVLEASRSVYPPDNPAFKKAASHARLRRLRQRCAVKKEQK